jgi:hypothetical protein
MSWRLMESHQCFNLTQTNYVFHGDLSQVRAKTHAFGLDLVKTPRQVRRALVLRTDGEPLTHYQDHD